MDHCYSEETGVFSDLFSEAAAIPPQGPESTPLVCLPLLMVYKAGMGTGEESTTLEV